MAKNKETNDIYKNLKRNIEYRDAVRVAEKYRELLKKAEEVAAVYAESTNKGTLPVTISAEEKKKFYIDRLNRRLHVYKTDKALTEGLINLIGSDSISSEKHFDIVETFIHSGKSTLFKKQYEVSDLNDAIKLLIALDGSPPTFSEPIERKEVKSERSSTKADIEFRKQIFKEFNDLYRAAGFRNGRQAAFELGINYNLTMTVLSGNHVGVGASRLSIVRNAISDFKKKTGY